MTRVFVGALVVCVFAAASFGIAGTVLSKSRASAILSAAEKKRTGFAPQCYPLVVDSVTTQGTWALVGASCRNNRDAVFNAVLHQSRGVWVFACSHGDDVMDAGSAVKRCGMTHVEALSLGFRDAPGF